MSHTAYRQAQRALIFGGRGFKNWPFLFTSLDLAKDMFGFTEICHGNCGKVDRTTGMVIEGADMFAGLWAMTRGIKCRSFPADWPKLQNAAGPIRNSQMLDEFLPHIGLGYPMGGSGSANMTSLLRGVGLPVWTTMYTIMWRSSVWPGGHIPADALAWRQVDGSGNLLDMMK